MVKEYFINGKGWQFEEGEQPEGAIEVKQTKPENKQAEPKNKARKVKTK